VNVLFTGWVTVKFPCYFTSNDNEKTIYNINIYTLVSFYDIDNNPALTEFCWCKFTHENEDATLEWEKLIHICQLIRLIFLVLMKVKHIL